MGPSDNCLQRPILRCGGCDAVPPADRRPVYRDGRLDRQACLQTRRLGLHADCMRLMADHESAPRLRPSPCPASLFGRASMQLSDLRRGSGRPSGRGGPRRVHVPGRRCVAPAGSPERDRRAARSGKDRCAQGPNAHQSALTGRFGPRRCCCGTRIGPPTAKCVWRAGFRAGPTSWWTAATRTGWLPSFRSSGHRSRPTSPVRSRRAQAAGAFCLTRVCTPESPAGTQRATRPSSIAVPSAVCGHQAVLARL